MRCLAVLLLACLACQSPPAQAPEAAAPAAVTFERGIHGHVLVPVSAGGHASLFLLDTGASADLVTPAFAKTLGLESKGSAESVGAGGSAGAVSVVVLPESRVGTERFAAHEVAVQEFDPEEPRVGGVLGRTFLVQHDTQIDLVRGQLRLFPAGTARTRPDLAPPGYAHVPFTDVGDLACVRVRLDGGEPVPAIVDFGATQSIVNREAASLVGVVPPKTGGGSVAVGADGRNIPVGIHVFRSLAVGDVTVATPTLVVADLPVFEQLGLTGPAVIVGLDVLGGRVVVLDYAEHEVVLSQRQ